MAIVIMILESLILLTLLYVGGLVLFGAVVDRMNRRERKS
jgi:hypothetical protein